MPPLHVLTDNKSYGLIAIVIVIVWLYAIIPDLINQLTLASETVADLQAQIDDLSKHDQDREQIIIKLNQKLDKLEALYKWDRLPWYKKLFTDPSDYFNPPDVSNPSHKQPE